MDLSDHIQEKSCSLGLPFVLCLLFQLFPIFVFEGRNKVVLIVQLPSLCFELSSTLYNTLKYFIELSNNTLVVTSMIIMLHSVHEVTLAAPAPI